MNDELKLIIMPLIDRQTKLEVPNIKVNFVEWFMDIPDPSFHVIHLN